MPLASFPSPPFNDFSVGPLDVHIYGILIALGVWVAIVVTRDRYAIKGGDPLLVERVAIWVIALGFLGARAAYVSTHLDRFTDRWVAVLFIWEGGLALYGGLTAGAITAVVLLRRHGGDVGAFADGAAIGIPLAQAIGRWGNYFNQELFGTPTDAPWAVEIEPAFRPARFAEASTFHPTFLYESLWNVALAFGLFLLDRRGVLKRGSLVFVYMIGYGLMRFLLELIRTDTTFRFLGLSRNAWVSVGVMIAGGVILYLREVRGEPGDEAPADDREEAAEPSR